MNFYHLLKIKKGSTNKLARLKAALTDAINADRIPSIQNEIQTLENEMQENDY